MLLKEVLSGTAWGLVLELGQGHHNKKFQSDLDVL